MFWVSFGDLIPPFASSGDFSAFFCKTEMLLFRRGLSLSATGESNAGTELPMVASLYRRNIDPTYGNLVAHYANIGMLDEYLLLVLSELLKVGKLFHSAY